MSYSARPFLLHHAIHSLSSAYGQVGRSQEAAGNVAWPSANLALYCPIRIPWRIVVTKLGTAVGIASGNLDLGLYDAAGVRVVSSGSTTVVANDQIVDVTDTTIGPGLYYLALCVDNTTATFARDSDAAPVSAAAGLLSEAVGAVTLPATATWSVAQTLAYYPLIWLERDTVNT